MREGKHLETSCRSQISVKREKQQLEELLLELEDAFTLDASELGETDLITHNIDTGARPVQTTPRRLPYALCKELEY